MKLPVIAAILFVWGAHRVDSKAILFQRIDVCRNWLGYTFFGYFPGCYFDQNVLARTSSLITRYNYQAERHKIVTPDGYILSMHRIVPKSPNSTAVILLHSMLTNSASFLALKRDSLAFMLADCGFDVFLPDIRGTEYSMEHMNMTINSEKFWDYSIDEVAKYDVPTMLEHVEKLTGQREAIVIGHGFGSTAVFMYSATNPEASRERIKMLIALGPITEQRNNNFWAWNKYLLPMYRPTYYLVKTLHMSKLLSYYDYQRNMASIYFYSLPYIYIRSVILSFGKDDQLTPEIIPFFVNHFFAGGSFKSFVHGTQLARAFTKFDYGKNHNMKVYGLERPPLYNVSKIVHPVYLISSDDDAVSDKTDSILLYTALSDQARSYGRFQIVRPRVNQMALVYGKDAAALIYNNILDLMGSISGNEAQCKHAIKQRQQRPAIEEPKKDEMVSSLMKGAKDMLKSFQEKPVKPINPSNKFNFNFLDLMKNKGNIDDKVILSPTGGKKAREGQKEVVEGLEKHTADESELSEEKDPENKSNLNDMLKSAFGWVKNKMHMFNLPEINLDMMGMGKDSSEAKKDASESSNRDPILVPSVQQEKLENGIVDTASYKGSGLVHRKSYKDPDPKNHNKIPDKIGGSDMRPKVLIKPSIGAINENDEETGKEKEESKESEEEMKEKAEEDEGEKNRKKRSISEHAEMQLQKLPKKQEEQEKKLDGHLAMAKQKHALGEMKKAQISHAHQYDVDKTEKMKKHAPKDTHQNKIEIKENSNKIQTLEKSQKVAKEKPEETAGGGGIKGFFSRMFG